MESRLDLHYTVGLGEGCYRIDREALGMEVWNCVKGHVCVLSCSVVSNSLQHGL